MPLQFSGKTTLLTWECMQRNPLPCSFAAQVAKKVWPFRLFEVLHTSYPNMQALCNINQCNGDVCLE